MRFQAENAYPLVGMRTDPVVYLVGVGALGVDAEPVMQCLIVDRSGHAGADRVAVFWVYVPEQEHVSVQELAAQIVQQVGPALDKAEAYVQVLQGLASKRHALLRRQHWAAPYFKASTFP